MLSSTVKPASTRDCWYVRASPRPARLRAGRKVTSCPNSSIVPELGGKSPAITLNSVVLPAPFGPRIARRSPGTTSRSTSRNACRPPKRRPTLRVRRAGTALAAVGASCTAASVKPLRKLADDLGRDHAVDDGPLLAGPRQGPLLARRERAPRRRRARAERAAERLVDLRHVRDRADVQLAVVQVELLDELILDRVAVLVEADRPVARVEHDLGQRLPQRLRGRVALRLPERDRQRPGRVEVVVQEAVRGTRRSRAGERRVLLVPPVDDGGVLLGGSRLQVTGRSEAADQRVRHARAEGLEAAGDTPEQVPGELLAVQRPVRLPERLQRRDQAGAADRPEVAVDLTR